MVKQAHRILAGIISSRHAWPVPHSSGRERKSPLPLLRTAVLAGILLLALTASPWAAERTSHPDLRQGPGGAIAGRYVTALFRRTVVPYEFKSYNPRSAYGAGPPASRAERTARTPARRTGWRGTIDDSSRRFNRKPNAKASNGADEDAENTAEDEDENGAGEEDNDSAENDGEDGEEEKDENRKFSADAVAAWGVQCQYLLVENRELDEEFAAPETCADGLPVQVGLTYRPNSSNEFHARIGIANDNGLNPVSPFALQSWAATLEDDVKNINGRDRDYLLEAWYRRRFTLRQDTTLDVTGGIIDSTNYLDDNAYANDEDTQFMNEVFVNAASALLPSYDAGGAAQLDIGQLSLRAVAMNVGENEDGNNYNFLGGQVGYSVGNALGKGTYRVAFGVSSNDFPDADGFEEQQRAQLNFSFDQEVGKTVGVFLRVGWQDDEAAVNHDALYSAGIDVGGELWGRKDDNIGVGYAYLSGGNLDISSTHVAEFYYRLALNDQLALTADVQYVRDEITDTKGPKGLLFGFRGVAQF